VHLKDGRPPISYDVLSIDVGSCPRPLDFSSATIPVTPVKPIDGFSARWNVILDRVVKSATPLRLVVVGGGAGGVELALSTHARLRRELVRCGANPDIISTAVVTHNAAVMPSHNTAVQRKMMRVLQERGIEVHLGCHVASVEGAELVCENGTRIAADEVLWCTQAGTQAWIRATGCVTARARGLRCVCCAP
jgi:selenide,water dikinase